MCLHGGRRPCVTRGWVGLVLTTGNMLVCPARHRWAIQRGAAVAAGTGANTSTTGEYAKENLGALSVQLSATDMVALNNMQL